jgi:prolyl-tRNA synthetase
VLEDIGLNKGDLKEEKSVEVGNIFSLGTKFSDALQLSYVDENGEKKPVIMGSYGIGPGRLIGTVVESLSDEKGIVWPKSIAPFDVHLIEINPKRDAAVSAEAQRVYELLTAKGVEVLWDERDASAGEKFADSDLIGIPVRYVVSAKTLADKSIEQKVRATQKTDMISASSI